MPVGTFDREIKDSTTSKESFKIVIVAEGGKSGGAA